MPDQPIIYPTGLTREGIPLIGGVWTLWEQEGFPLEMSHLVCQGNGWAVDWLEAMADATVTNNCPALMKHVEAFLPSGVVDAMQLGFVLQIDAGNAPAKILSDKRENGLKFSESIAAAKAAQQLLNP